MKIADRHSFVTRIFRLGGKKWIIEYIHLPRCRRCEAIFIRKVTSRYGFCTRIAENCPVYGTFLVGGTWLPHTLR